MTSYKTLLHAGEGVYEEKRSVFYGFAFPVTEESRVREEIDAIRARFPDARHHCYAYLLREGNTTRYSDDREPQGTAGMPILDLLRKSGLTDALVVVVRYFGGTLLGTGGLVRAYTAAAKAAVENAETAVAETATGFAVSLAYPDYERVQLLLSKKGTEVLAVDYGTRVVLSCRTREALYAETEDAIRESTAARAVVTRGETAFVLRKAASAE